MLECLQDDFASDDCRDVRYAYSKCKHSQHVKDYLFRAAQITLYGLMRMYVGDQLC